MGRGGGEERWGGDLIAEDCEAPLNHKMTRIKAK